VFIIDASISFRTPELDINSTMSADGIDFHPASQWEEPYDAEAHRTLTLYDLCRYPRPVKSPDTRLTVSTKNLISEFMCPICLGYIRKASVVTACLHRFCDECIQKCLRFGKKECPSCRIHIPTRRSLRRDEDFDLLLQHILGDVTVLEQAEEREAELAKSQSICFSATRKQGMLHQQQTTLQYKVC
jgi:E3 ubiquitin-protein ligase RNF1/2